MTIKELIEKLKMYPEGLRVLVDGYEGGFSEIAVAEMIKVKLDVNSEEYYGPHDEAEDADTDVLVLRRRD